MKKITNPWATALLGLSVAVSVAACSSMKTPTTAKVAVSNAAVESAAAAGGTQYAPIEMTMAREKMASAQKAMADNDYEKAAIFAEQAQVDAKLAQSKANSAKAQVAADALQADIQVLREELKRTTGTTP